MILDCTERWRQQGDTPTWMLMNTPYSRTEAAIAATMQNHDRGKQRTENVKTLQWAGAQ